jgi:hypothetical protein
LGGGLSLGKARLQGIAFKRGKPGLGGPGFVLGESGLRPHDRERRLPTAVNDATGWVRKMETLSPQIA